MANGVAEIDMAECIHCGTCHSVCPQDAVRHDSELIPGLVEDNVAMTVRFMDDCARHLGDASERSKCLNRMIKHFTKERVVAEKTLARLQAMKRDDE